MNVYVDNVDGVDDVNHGLSAAMPIKTLSYIFSVPGFASGSTVYIKATGIEYQLETGHRLLDFYTLGYSGITFDRYPTDTGTSRPILSHTADYAYGQDLIRLDGDNFTITNLHFKGKAAYVAGQSDSFIDVVRTCLNLSIQNCIFEQDQTMKGIKLNTFDYTGLAISNCYFSVADDVKDTYDLVRAAITRGTSAVLYGTTIEDNIFENYVITLYTGFEADPNSEIIIDHNTFIECARHASGYIGIINMQDATVSVTFTNNIIYNSADITGSYGIKYAGSSNATFTAGHNTWTGIDNHYYGLLDDDGSDLDIEPIWQGGVKEWEAAHILLPVYYAPVSTQFSLVFGADDGSTIGAIAVTYETTLDVAYVDNTVIASGNGTTEETALKTINEAMLAINNNGTVHIKASGVSYTGENDNNNILIANKSDVTIDIYGNIADRGDKPIIDYSDDKDNGCIFKIIGCSNLVIRNLHFKGVTDSAKTTSLIDFSFIDSSDVLINKCRFEGKQAKKILYFEKEVTGIEMTYCYMDTERTDLASASVNCIDASNSDGGATKLVFKNNIIKNFTRALYLLYHGIGDNEISHNTFINAGVGGANRCVDLDNVVAATAYQINSNILFGPDDETGVGFNWADTGGTIVSNYNDIFGYNVLYSGDASAGSYDLNVDPGWPNYKALWYDADIYLNDFYYPTNEDVLTGGLSVMGAITLPPVNTDTEINELQKLDGSPYFCVNSDLFNRLKSHLIDANIYDTSKSAIGLSNSRILISGNANFNPNITITLHKYYKGETYIVGSVLTDAFGNWSIPDKLSHGRAAYHAVGDEYRSSSYHVNAYNIHVWLCAYASDFAILKSGTAQTRQNNYISNSVDFDGNSIETDGYYLTRNFGQFISARKLETMSEDEYRELLVDVLSAYNLGPTDQSFDLICEAFTGRIPTIEYYSKTLWAFPDPDIMARLRVLGAPSLNYEWSETEVYLYDRRWDIPAGSGVIPQDTSIYVYVDGESPVGINNQLSIRTKATRPQRYEMTWTETISSGLVNVDVYGTETGVSGELYVTTSRLPLEINGVSGGSSPFTDGIDEAYIVPHTSNIDLGSAQENMDKTGLYGDITVSYQTNYEFIILGNIEAGPAAITNITESDWIDGGGDVYRDANIASHCGEIRIHDSQNLSIEARADLFQTLKDIKSGHKFFYVFMENAITGTLEYYGII